LLEKPIATSMEDARRLEDAATEGNVASIVFFTRRFVPQGQAWLEQVRERGGWYFGRAETTVNIFVEGGPYAGSSWRREYGALWDIGPHALSQLVPVLGPVTSAMAGAGRGDQVHLILQHGEGRTSTASLTLSAPSAATGSSLYFDGEHGRETFASRPLQSGDLISAHQAALDALIDRAAQSDHGHPCDVHFGARVVDILDAARRSLASGCRVDVPGLGRDGAPV
jgi:predicted dehydrogenase